MFTAFNEKKARREDRAALRTFSYDLYNTATEQVEATERFTATVQAGRNRTLRLNGEPQRWVPTPWIRGGCV